MPDFPTPLPPFSLPPPPEVPPLDVPPPDVPPPDVPPTLLFCINPEPCCSLEQPQTVHPPRDG